MIPSVASEPPRARYEEACQLLDAAPGGVHTACGKMLARGIKDARIRATLAMIEQASAIFGAASAIVRHQMPRLPTKSARGSDAAPRAARPTFGVTNRPVTSFTRR